MKATKIIIAVVLTLGMLLIARMNSRGRPEHVMHTENGVTFDMMTVPKIPEHSLGRIPVTINGVIENKLTAQMRLARFGQDDRTPLQRYATAPLTVEDSATGKFYGDIQAVARGGRSYYYLEVRDQTGGLRASLTADEGRPFVVKYIGEVSGAILAGHIALMFATVFFVVLAALNSCDILRDKGEVRPIATAIFWATLAAFLGGYPFGFAMNWYAFGTIWEGIPFGTDATDNKTQLLFVYLLLVALSSLGSLTNGRLGRDHYSPRTMGRLGIGALGLMLFTYLIPHSIQFSPQLTWAVCGTFIIVAVLTYLVGLARRPRGQISSARKR